MITVCDRAREECPVFSGAPDRLHWPFEDPAAFTEVGEERLLAFRRLRDRIPARVMVFLGEGAYGSREAVSSAFVVLDCSREPINRGKKLEEARLSPSQLGPAAVGIVIRSHGGGAVKSCYDESGNPEIHHSILLLDSESATSASYRSLVIGIMQPCPVSAGPRICSTRARLCSPKPDTTAP